VKIDQKCVQRSDRADSILVPAPMFAPIAGLEVSMTRRSVFVTLTCVALLFSQLLAAVALAAEVQTLRGVHNGAGRTMTPFTCAGSLGCWPKHGLEHSLHYIAATTAVQALAAGSEEIGLVGNQCVEYWPGRGRYGLRRLHRIAL